MENKIQGPGNAFTGLMALEVPVHSRKKCKLSLTNNNLENVLSGSNSNKLQQL